MPNLYLTFALIGTVVPYYYFGSFALTHGLDIPMFIREVVAARASMGFVADLFISSLAFWPYLFREARKGGLPSPWLFVALNLGIGLSCALPLFLYFMERREQG